MRDAVRRGRDAHSAGSAVRVLILHLPLLALFALLLLFELVHDGVLGALRTEETFGWMLVVGYPSCALLGLAQVVVWGWWVRRRGPAAFRMRGGVGIAVVIVAFLLFAIVVARRWGVGASH